MKGDAACLAAAGAAEAACSRDGLATTAGWHTSSSVASSITLKQWRHVASRGVCHAETARHVILISVRNAEIEIYADDPLILSDADTSKFQGDYRK